MFKAIKQLFNQRKELSEEKRITDLVLAMSIGEAYEQTTVIISKETEYQIKDSAVSPLVDMLGEFTRTFFLKYHQLEPVASHLRLGHAYFEEINIDGLPSLVKLGMDNTCTVACRVSQDEIFMIEDYYESIEEIGKDSYPSVCHAIVADYLFRYR